MSATDIIRVGDPLPEIASVTAHDPFTIAVTFGSSYREAQLVDLGPAILTYKAYRPLRDDPDLFKAVRVTDEGAAIAWGEGKAITMAATTIEHIANEHMSSDDFAAFVKRHRLSLDAAAGQLGISRRLVAYYMAGRPVPRYIALACRYLEHEWGPPVPEAAINGEAEVVTLAERQAVGS